MSEKVGRHGIELRERAMDRKLEDAITAAGRDKVFAIVRAAGWTGYDAPPKWVWREAVAEARCK